MATGAVGESPLKRLEGMIEGLVDGVFRRSARHLQPVEVASHLTRHAESQRMISLDHVYVPNRFLVHVNPEDMEILRTFEHELEAEFARYVGDWVAEHDYSVSGPIRVELRTREGIEPGRFTVTSAWSDLPTAAEAEEETGVCAETIMGEPVGRLEGVGGPDLGRAHTLYPHRMILGRAPDCQIQLRDPMASRHHAALDRRGDEWYVQDLESTNGIRINGQKVAGELRVRDGDMLKIGSTTMKLTLKGDA
jgi:hypothetical protein